MQSSISEWMDVKVVVVDESDGAASSRPVKDRSPPQLPDLPSQPHILSPILSQPTDQVCSNEADLGSPITKALNIAAEATSLRSDFALCEQIMTEKHQFLVSILDGMDRKLDCINEQVSSLENRIQLLEDHQSQYVN